MDANIFCFCNKKNRQGSIQFYLMIRKKQNVSVILTTSSHDWMLVNIDANPSRVSAKSGC